MSKNNLIILLVIILLGLAGFIAYPYVFPPKETAGQKIDKALNSLSEGIEDAGKALEGK
jgi:hypothetical protein